MSLPDALRLALPDAWIDGAAREPGSRVDITGRDLGEPLGWVRPRQTNEVARVIELARAHGARIAVAGARTAYWRPLDFAGALVLDVRGLDAVGEVRDGVLEVGGGARVRDVEAAMRAGGASLMAHPDAYGESTVGAMVATAFASGIGMGRATVAELVTGLEVVLGTGEVIQTGASRALGAGGFTRLGLPDPTALFFGSEGALGVVTRVALRAPPARPRAALEWGAGEAGPAMREAIALARELRARAYETFRVEVKAEGGPPRVQATLILDAPFGEAELRARLDAARAMISARFDGAIEERADPPRWWGEPAAHWSAMRAGAFRGVDVIVSYDEAEAAVEVAGALYAEARALEGLRSLRCALYFAPGYVNFGAHALFSDDALEDADAFEADARARLAALRSIPYRWGRDAEASHGARLDPGYRALLRDLKRRCDPDSILGAGGGLGGGE